MNELDALLADLLGPFPAGLGENVDGDLWSRLTEAGLTRLAVPEELGGSGGTTSDAAVVVAGAAERAMTVPLGEHTLVAGHLAAALEFPVPPSDFRISLVPGLCRVATGGRVALAGIAGRSAGPTETWMVARDSSETYLLPWAADPARVRTTRGAPEPRWQLDLDGLTVDAAPGRRGPARLHGEVGLLLGLIGALRMLGALRSCFALTRRYAQLRSQFGRAIGTRQVIAHAVVEMAGELAATEAGVRTAVDQLPDPGRPIGRTPAVAIAAARVQAAGAATRTAQIAHQVHGAVGMTAEHALHEFTTRLWAWRDDDGTERSWATRLAKLVDAPDLWAVLTDQSAAPAALDRSV